MKTAKRSRKREMTAEDFIALPDDEKHRIVAEIEAHTPEEHLASSKPLNARERREWRKIRSAIRRGRGRPRLGDDLVQRVSVSIERSLLDQIDRYAKANKLNRSALFVRGAANFIGAKDRKLPAKKIS